MTAERKLLFRLVQGAMANPGDDRIRSRVGNLKTYEQLRSLGFIRASENSAEDQLTDQAFEVVFDTFEQIPCPPEVQRLVEELGVERLRWRVGDRFINQNQAQPFACTIFIKDPPTARLSSWFHELGHVLFHLDESSCASG